MNSFFKCCFFLCCILFFNSCANETPIATIPFAPVNFKIDVVTDKIDNFDYAIFDVPRRQNEYVGFSGLLIFGSYDGRIFAYDLCCPNEDRKEIRVNPMDNGKAVCPVCGSVFVLMYGLGTPELGPAIEHLQRYSVIPGEQSGVFYVRN